MFENWKQVESEVNTKETEVRANKSSAPIADLPPELQAYITETISNDVELSSEEAVLSELRLENVKKAARSFHELDKRREKLQLDKLEFEKRFIITSGKNRPPQVIEAMRKIENEIANLDDSVNELMQSNPEAYIVRNALELRNYRKQLKESDFVLTPYGERKLKELENNYYSMDKIPFLNGETGSGKSSIAKYFCKDVLKTDSERIAGAKGIDETKIFGKISLSSDENGPQAVFIKGPLYLAMEKGVPLIIEEVNAIPPEILKSLNDIIINAKKGDEVPVIGDPKGSKVKALPGFGVIMTGNLNRNPKAIDRYKGLFELSADFVNRIRPIDYDYLPQSTEGNHVEEAGEGNELYTLMIAMVMNDKGDISAPEDVFDDLWRLAKFTRKVQEVYSGQRDGKLFSRQGGLDVPVTATSSVVSMRDIKQVIESWKRDNFKNELDFYIYKELIAPLTNVMDTKFFVQQLQAEGFLVDESWKEVVSKAGTFDSAIHAPENDGKELEFVTVRKVVENVYGKAPERIEFPYDLQAVKKAKDETYKIKSYLENIDKQVGYLDKHSKEYNFDDVHALRDEVVTNAEALLEKINLLISNLADDKHSAKERNETIKNLSECLESSEIKKVTESTRLIADFSDRLELCNAIQGRCELEVALLDKVRKTYTNKFKIDEDFISKHGQIAENIRKLENVFGNNEDGTPISFKDASVKKIHLETRLLSEGDESGDLQKEIEALDKKIHSEYLDVIGPGLNLKNNFFNYLEDYLLNLRSMEVGAGSIMNYNIIELQRNGEFEKRYPKEVVEMDIEIDPKFDEVIRESKYLFEDQKSVEMRRYYGKGSVVDGPNAHLEQFRISANNMRNELKGFMYVEPWMILGLIYNNEAWLVGKNGQASLRELFKDPLFFCVKTEDDKDNIIKVERKDDYKWSIKVVEDETVVGHQFIAAEIFKGAVNYNW